MIKLKSNNIGQSFIINNTKMYFLGFNILNSKKIPLFLYINKNYYRFYLIDKILNSKLLYEKKLNYNQIKYYLSKYLMTYKARKFIDEKNIKYKLIKFYDNIKGEIKKGYINYTKLYNRNFSFKAFNKNGIFIDDYFEFNTNQGIIFISTESKFENGFIWVKKTINEKIKLYSNLNKEQKQKLNIILDKFSLNTWIKYNKNLYYKQFIKYI